MPALPKLLSAEELKVVLKSGTPDIKVLDCTYYMGPAYDRKEFYGKFEELMRRESKQKKDYLEAHIPTAVHFDLDVATYPSQYQRLTRYEASEFERYARLLGINKSDHLVFYGRGPAGGMLFAARAYWLFKSYGHESVSLLNGGFEAWRRCGFEAEILSDEYPTPVPGNWDAVSHDSAYVTFEQLTNKGTYGADLLSNPTNGSMKEVEKRDPKRISGGVNQS